MSFFTYMACGRESPTGCFGIPPKAMYHSYPDYRHSPDYVAPRLSKAEQAEVPAVRERRKDSLAGNVAVYETYWETRSLTIESFQPREDTFGLGCPGGDPLEVHNLVTREVLMRHFTLPFLYSVDDSHYLVPGYLYRYLEPGEYAETYTCWPGEEAEPRSIQDVTVDLATFGIRRPDSTDWGPDDQGRFIRYLVPSTRDTGARLDMVERLVYAVVVIREPRMEWIEPEVARAVGL